MTRELSRRTLLAIGAAAAIAPRSYTSRTPRAAAPGSPFIVGVCAGDPDERSAVLWTRLTMPDGTPLGDDDVAVTWELARDDAFTSVIATGETLALAGEAHSVHAVVDLDGPALYRFRTGAWVSPTGRVAPSGATPDRLRIAAASCQHYETGFYAAHADIAAWAPDLVVFLGDFVYEYGGGNLGGAVLRSHAGGETVTLDDYRRRYALYLADAQLQAARATCPWLVIWDDHEVDNNYADGVAEDGTDADRFAARKLAGYQAWWEHMPVRMPRPGAGADPTIYRSVSWGTLAELILLDGRQYRTDQACGDVVLSVDPACPETTDRARTMLGAEQERWLGERLAATAATWPVIAQQTVLTDVTLPNGAVLNYDQWDGYPKARDRLLLQAAEAARAIVLTGDIHLAAVGRLPGVGVEFVSTSISSPSNVPSDVAEFLIGFPNVVDAELAHRGYTRHIVTSDTWTAEYRTVDDAADPQSPVSTWKTFAVDAATRDAVTVR